MHMDRLGYFDSEDDILPYLDFSDPPPPTPISQPQADQLLPPQGQTEIPAQELEPGWRLNYLNSILQGMTDLGGSISWGNNDETVFVPIKPGDLDCSDCCPLREIIHSNGYQNVKVVVHGGSQTSLKHAIFEIECQDEMGQPAATDLYFIDLSMMSGEWVGSFLEMYIMFLDADDSIVLEDNVNPAYTLLCGEVKQELEDYSIVNSWLQIPEQEAEEGDGSTPISPRTKPKTGLALQRERAHNMKLNDLADYFHLPIADAAKKLQLCSTAIKHACRRNGVARWPSRKIKSIDRQLASLERQLLNLPADEVMEKRKEFEELKAKRERLYAGLDL